MATAAPKGSAIPYESRPSLSEEELRKMHAYWRAANYLSVGQIYLYANPERGEAAPAAATKPGGDVNALIVGAAKDLADYQRLTAEGKLGEAGQKLEQSKRKLDELDARQK
jgi:XFP N-terminal domain